MIAIIHVDDEPLYCFEIKNLYETDNISAIIEKWGKIRVLEQIIKNGKIYLNCKIEKIEKDFFLIENNPDYPITPGKITPIWFKNNCGKQITFLIEEEIKMCTNCFCISSDNTCPFCGGKDFLDDEYPEDSDE